VGRPRDRDLCGDLCGDQAAVVASPDLATIMTRL
jgi:hypothetical protein